MPDAVVEVVAGVVVRGGAVLICQRPPGGHHPGKWEFPGGKVEPGETLEEALRRELKEELDIDATAGTVLWRTEHQYPGRPPFALAFIRVATYEGELHNRIFASVCWARITTLRDYDFLEGDREFIGHIERGAVTLD